MDAEGGCRGPTASANVRFPLQGFSMRFAALIVGILAVLMGLLWIGQGTGRIHWPASSFMIDQRPWVTRGAILAVIGLVLIVASRVRR
jgi:hypothetical protein